jgi:3D (Asp-Asp-Asp) domain-containing protein
MATRTYRAQGSGYFPDKSALEGGFKDRRGINLNTLQDYLAKKADYVSVAMDPQLAIPYGTVVKITEIEADRGQTIEFRVVDTGGAFKGKGFTRIDICTADRHESLDPTINGMLTLTFSD